MDLLGTIGGLVSGFMGQQAADKNREAQEQINSDNYQHQKEFAQMGIQWKVDDARAAGINPLAALGASTQSFSNLVAPQTDGSPLGQGIERALKAAATPDDREFDRAKQVQTLQHGELENQLLASQIAKENAQVGPPMPAVNQKYLVDGQGPSVIGGTSAVKIKPDEVTAKSASDPSVAAGSHTDVAFSNIGGGYYVPIPAADLNAVYASSGTAAKLWDMRNLYLPTIGVNSHPPFPPPGDKEWGFNPFTGYSLHSKGRFSPLTPDRWSDWYATHGGTGY